MIAINYKYYLTRPCFRTGICSYDLGDPSYIKGKIKFSKVCIFYITTSDSQGNPKCHHWDYLRITHDHLPFRICKHMFDNPAIDIIKRFVPAFHNSFSRGNELIHFMLRVAAEFERGPAGNPVFSVRAPVQHHPPRGNAAPVGPEHPQTAEKNLRQAPKADV